MRLLFAVAAAVFVAGGANAAEYKVHKGDTLIQIGQHTGFTVQQLIVMNPLITQPGQILVGQRITYFDDHDVADAIRWCKKRIGELPPSDENVSYFTYAVEDLQAGHIRYSIEEPSGTYVTDVLLFAKAWREYNS